MLQPRLSPRAGLRGLGEEERPDCRSARFAGAGSSDEIVQWWLAVCKGSRVLAETDRRQPPLFWRCLAPWLRVLPSDRLTALRTRSAFTPPRSGSRGASVSSLHGAHGPSPCSPQTAVVGVTRERVHSPSAEKHCWLCLGGEEEEDGRVRKKRLVCYPKWHSENTAHWIPFPSLSAPTHLVREYFFSPE